MNYERITKISKFIPLLTLAVSILSSIFIRPDIYSHYPIGGDSGIFYSLAAAYKSTWPFIPSENPFVPNYLITSENLPLLHWLMGGVSRIFDVNLFDIVKFTPLVLTSFTSIIIYAICRQLFKNPFVAPMSAFFFLFSDFQLSYGINSYPSLTDLSIALITSWVFVFVKFYRSTLSIRSSWHYYIMGGIIVSLILINHDLSIVAFAIILIGFILISLLFKFKFGKKGIEFFRYPVFSILLGLCMASPIFYFWREFLVDRLIRVSAGGGGVNGVQIKNIIHILPNYPMGLIELLLCIIGIVLSIIIFFKGDKNLTSTFESNDLNEKEVIKKEKLKTGTIYFILVFTFWFLSMLAVFYSYTVGITFVNQRFLFYLTVPLAIFAALGLVLPLEVLVRKIGFKDLSKNTDRKNLSLHFYVILACIGGFLCTIILVQISYAYSDLAWAKEHLGRSFIDKNSLSCMYWIRDNTKNSVIVASQFNPYSTIFYYPGITGKQILVTLDPVAVKGNYIEDRYGVFASKILATNDLSGMIKIISSDLSKYDVYVLVGKENLGLAEMAGDYTNLKGMHDMYDEVYDGNDCIIFHVDLNSLAQNIPLSVRFPDHVEGLTINPITNMVYTAVAGNNISVLDADTQNAVTTFSIGGDIKTPDTKDMTIDPYKNIIYVTNPHSNSLDVINGSTNAGLYSLDLGIGINQVAMNTKTGIVYVTRSEAGQLISINGSTHSVTNVMDLGAGVAGIAINNKNIIYVTNPHSNSLDVINGSTNELMTKLDVGKAPSRVAVNPITNLVYVVNSLSDNISVINGSTNKIIETVLTGDRPSGISIDLQNNLIFIINFNSDDLSVINGTTNEVIGYIKTGKGPSSIDFDPVTKKIFVSNYWSNEVSIIDENDLLVTLSNNRNTLQNTNWISSPGWDLSSRSVNINQYSFSKENNTLTIAFKAIMSDDSYLSYSNNLKNEGIKVHNLPFIAVVFDKYGPSNPKDLLMTIGFTDGTIKNIHLNDATSFNGHELAMIDNRQNQDKIYGNITIYAESFHPATQTGELNYRIDFHSIKFLHIPMVPP